MTAREKDSVNYSINEYSALAGEYTRNINYFNIEMEKGEVVEGVLPAYDKAELEKDTRKVPMRTTDFMMQMETQ